MNPTLSLFADQFLGLYLLNVALGSTVLAGLGLLVARVLRSQPTPLRHGVLLAAFILVLLAPLLAAVSLRCGFGVVGMPAQTVEAAHPVQASELGVAWEAPAALTHRANAAQSVRRPSAEAQQGGTLVVPPGDLETASGNRAPVETAVAPVAHQSVGAAAWQWLALLLIAAWGVGAAWQAASLARGLWLVRRLRQSLRRPSDPRWAQLATQTAHAVGLRRPPEVALSDVVSSPVSFGIFRPVVVIPTSLDGGLPDRDIEGVLLHEAAHIGLRDHLAGLVQRLAGALFWWHPLIRQLRRVLDDVKEELCDDHVIQAQGDGVAFAHCLVRLAEWSCDGKPLPTAIGVLGSRFYLERRVLKLLQRDRKVMTRMTRGMIVKLALFVATAAGLTAACTLRAAAPPAKPAPPSETEQPSAEKPSAEDLRRLVDQLGDRDFSVREKADKELVKLGKTALPALLKGLKNPDAEVRRRLGKLIAEIGPAALPALNEAEKSSDKEFRLLARDLIAVIEATIDPEIKRIKALGGIVECDDKNPAHPVVKVKLSTTWVTDYDLRVLATFKDLKELNLAYTGIADAGLKELPVCKGLRSLDLTMTRLSDAGLRSVAELTKLQELNLSYTSVTAAGLRQLASLKGLRTLNLASAKMSDEGLRELAGFEGLRSLTVSGLKDRNMKELVALKGLQSLSLCSTDVTEEGLKELTALENLQELSLNQTEVTADGLKELAALKSLKALDLINTKVTDSGLNELAALTELKSLVLTNTKVTDAGIKELTALKGLHSLDLINTKVTDAGLRELAALKGLQVLRLQGTQVTDAGLKELAVLKRLRLLTIFDCANVTDAGAAELTRLCRRLTFGDEGNLR